LPGQTGFLASLIPKKRAT